MPPPASWPGSTRARPKKTDVTDIRNPVVLRVFREVRRQFSAICREFGFLPGRVHVELLREVGKSGEERNRISRGPGTAHQRKGSRPQSRGPITGQEPGNGQRRGSAAL